MASFFDPGSSAWRYIVRMGLTSLVPSSVLALLLFGLGILREEQGPQFALPQSPRAGLLLFFRFVVDSPIVETLLMSPILGVLSRAVQKPALLAALSAAVWMVVHSLAAPAWGLIIAWPFYVFSRAYLAWRPYGWRKAIGVTACIHAFHNFLPGLAVLLVGFAA
jgi:hypothetical protein